MWLTDKPRSGLRPPEKHTFKKTRGEKVAQVIKATQPHLLQLCSSSLFNKPSNLQKVCKHTVKDYLNTQPCRTHDGVMPAEV